ncbi:hypothetical protein [Streptomyces sp. NPDC051642]
MRYLIDQARAFRARATAAHTVRADSLARPLKPRAFFIACSDARSVLSRA